MAITVKKKKLTLKSQKVKPDAAEVEVAEEGQGVAASTPEEPVVGPALPGPGHPVVGIQQGPSYTWAAMLALTAVLVLLAILALQGLEWNWYEAPPPAFPAFRAAVLEKAPTGAMPVAGFPEEAQADAQEEATAE
jgi:hypothetical protein